MMKRNKEKRYPFNMDNISRQIIDAVKAGGKNEMTAKEYIVSLLNEDPNTVRSIIRELCAKEYLLHEACLLGDEELVTLLTAFCPDLNEYSHLGSPLSIACEHGYESIVDVLLCSQAVVPLPDSMDVALGDDDDLFMSNCRCPFYLSSKHGWTAILKMLVEHSLDAFKDVENCKRLLQLACLGGHISIFEYCLETIMQVVDSRDEISFFIKNSNELLTLCLKLKKISLVSCLLDRGAIISKELIDLYDDSIGLYLSQYVSKAQQSSNNDCMVNCRSPDDRRSSDLSNKLVCLDWSKKYLSGMNSNWMSPFMDHVYELDLSYNRISFLPDVVPWALPNLHRLVVVNCHLVALLSPENAQIKCTKLEIIELSNNELMYLPIEMFQIPSLKLIYLENNQLQELYPSTPPTEKEQQWRSTNLREIIASKNDLVSIPNQIRSCGHLVKLLLSNNKLTSFLQPWPCPLKRLNLSENYLSSLPLGFEDFWSKTLQDLNLSKNKLTEIPLSVCRLAMLKDLDVSHNEISELPICDMWQCSYLESMDLSHNTICWGEPVGLARSLSDKLKQSWLKTFRADEINQNLEADRTDKRIVEFPSIFSKTLTDINLSYNQLSSVPTSVCQMTELTKLDLGHNPNLKVLPDVLCNLLHLDLLLLDGLELYDPELNRLVSHGASTRVILAHLKQKHRQCIPYYRFKLMIVGSQDKGKTALACAIRNIPLSNQVNATDGVEITECKLPSPRTGLSNLISKSKGDSMPDLTAQIWDFSGHQDYSVTHKVFLSSSALYLVVFDLRLHQQGANSLRAWLSDIQAHAPDAHVIIVGTFLDYLTDGRSRLPELHQYIMKTYTPERGFPKIEGIIDVSCTKKEGLEELRKLIYNVALKIRVRVDVFEKEKLVGKMVPRDYLELVRVVQTEVERCKQQDLWPVLDEEEFSNLFSSLLHKNIHNKEELDLATQFMQEAGYLLRYTGQLHGLGHLYFICPQWLANTLVKFSAADEIQKCMKSGIISLSDAEEIFFQKINIQKNHLKNESCTFNQYLDLLEAFDIALRLDNDRLLLPTRLPADKPGLQGIPSLADSDGDFTKLMRLYWMKHMPSGFWSRLLVQLIGTAQSVLNPSQHQYSGVRQSGMFQNISFTNLTFWQEGICMETDYNACIVVESVSPYLSESELESSMLQHGVLITVFNKASTHISNNNSELISYSLLAMATDYVDTLIEQWYSGLLDEGCMEQRIPCPSCCSKSNIGSNSFKNVHMFTLIECAKVIFSSKSKADLTISCNICSEKRIFLNQLVPDLLLLDLQDEFHVDLEDINFDVNKDILGRGGEGIVYRGNIGGKLVAIKQNSIFAKRKFADINKSPSEETEDNYSSGMDCFWKKETLNAFSGFRQETTILAQLYHPCIVSLLGVSVLSLSYVMELCPHASLRQILLSKTSRREGFVMGKLLTYKIVYQIVSALEYLHSHKLVYKDMKPENILVWSEDVDDIVNVKLSDYGLTRRLTQQGLMGVEGTTGYQAPEIRQRKPYNEKVDIFAFAMVAYELVTGEQCFREMSSIVINKLLQQGKRPPDENLQDIQLNMASLIRQCWSHEPVDRPSASKLRSMLTDISFVFLERIVALEDHHIHGTISFAYWDNKQNLPPHLRIWTGNETGRCYHIFNASLHQFKVINQCHPGSKVMCMILLERLMVIGTEKPCLELMGFNRNSNKLEKISPLLCTNDIPLLIIPRQKKILDEFFVGFANSELHLYSLSVSSTGEHALNKKHGIYLSDSDQAGSSAVICGVSLNDGQELWLGCGPDIVIVEVNGDVLNRSQRVDVFSMLSVRQRIGSICENGDQVWCLSRRDAIVVELDLESRQILCVFNCSGWNPLNEVISNFEWMDAMKRTSGQKSCDTGNEVAPDEVPAGKKFEKVQIRRTSAERRKISWQRKRSVRSFKQKRPMKVCSNQLEIKVRTLCFVKGALWVGRSKGDILVINVTQNNSYGYEHGQVLAVLGELDYPDEQSVDSIFNLNNEQVVVTRTLNRRDVRQKTQLLVWSAFGLNDFNRYNRSWNELESEILKGRHVKRLSSHH